jgi:hypothetical protein
LTDEYETVQPGDDRLFTDYLSELRDYEAIRGDTTTRERYRMLKRGLNEDLKRSICFVFTARRRG